MLTAQAKATVNPSSGGAVRLILKSVNERPLLTGRGCKKCN